MAIVAFKPIGSGMPWKHALINSVTNDRENQEVYEFKIDHENTKKQIHVVFTKGEALTMTRDLISSLIETGNLEQIQQYVIQGTKDLEELKSEKKS